MSKYKVDTYLMKNLLIGWLRYKKQYPCVASEVQRKDVACKDKKGNVMEFEIKISKSDFLNNFKKTTYSKKC